MNHRTICCAIMTALAIALGTMTARAITMPTTGLKVWLKADAITGLNDGASLDVWGDSSGNGNDATNGGTVRPTFQTNELNGNPVVRFDGINTNYLQNTAYTHGANDLTLFAIAKRNGNPVSGYHTIFIGGMSSYTAAGGYLYQMYVDAATNLWANFSTAGLKINTGVKFTNTTYQILAITKSAVAGNSEYFINGATRGTGTGTQTLYPNFYIGSWNKNNLNGDIAEIALYNKALSATDRELVEGLMAWKYGLQGNLPPSHTWKNVDPATKPQIENASPAFISSTQATLMGYLATTGTLPSTVSVFWGSQDGGAALSGLWQHTNTFAESQWASGSYPSTNVALPTPNIAYYYRFYVTNAAGEWAAADSKSFIAADNVAWIQSAAGTHYWTNSANWSPAVVPNWAGVSVVITNDRASNQTINVDQSITLGELIIGNTNNIALAKLTGAAFRFDNGAFNPRIQSTTGTNSMAVDVTYGSGTGLDITNDSSFSASGVLGGFSNLVKRGAGTFALTGANNFTGDLVIKDGSYVNTGSASGAIPDSAVIQAEGGATFAMARTDVIKGARGAGWIRYTGGAVNGKLIMGTNTTGASAAGYTYVVQGGILDPGFGADIGALCIAGVSSGGDPAHIMGGDIFIDIASASSYDTITFYRGGGAGNRISGGNLHLNFLSGYTPTNGSSWDIMARVVSGTISDPNGGDLFDSIDANIGGYSFRAEIIPDATKVRLTATARRGALILIR